MEKQQRGEFDEQILAELISQGFSGEELSRRFRAKQAQVRPAVERMLAAADDAAHGKGEYYTYAEVFGAATAKA